MRKNSLAQQFSAYFLAATLAAESNLGEKGFRQKDLRFFVELFANWMEATLPGGELGVHNAQISRFLSTLEANGFANRIPRAKIPRYRLSRGGILGVLQELVEQPEFLPLELFFFVHYFIRHYGGRIDEMAREQGAQFPRALKLEIDSLLSPAALVERQLRYVDKELQKLDERISDAQISTRLVATLFSEGRDLAAVVQEVQRRHPYKLNNQKPLEELFAELPERTRRMEIEQGSLQRATHLWTPLRDSLLGYRSVLRQLA